MSKQLVEAWLKARPTVLVCLREESDWDKAVVVRFVFKDGECGYEWKYDFMEGSWADGLDEFVESVVSYMKDTLGIDEFDYGYPQIFEMVAKERGGLK